MKQWLVLGKWVKPSDTLRVGTVASNVAIPAAGITNSSTAYSSNLKLVQGGSRTYYSGVLVLRDHMENSRQIQHLVVLLSLFHLMVALLSLSISVVVMACQFDVLKIR